MGKNKVLISVETDTRKANRGLKGTSKEVNKLGGSLKRTGKAAAAMKVKLLAIGAAAAAAVVGLSRLVKEFVSFEFELGKVASLVDDNRLVFGEFAEDIRGLSTEFGQTKSTLTKGLFDIISATIEADEAMGVLRASTMLAVAGFAQTSETTSALITVYQTFRDELKDTADAADFLFTVAKRGRLTLGDVAKTIGVVASTAKAANVTLNEFGAAFSAISGAGIGAERTVVQLAALIKVFNKPSKEAIPILEKYNVAIGNASIANGELFKTIDKLKGAKIDEINLLFVEETAMRGFNNLLIRQSKLHEELAAQLNRSGLVVEAMTDAQKLAGNQIARATEEINLQKEAIGRGLTPTYIELLRAINDLIIGMGYVKNLWDLPEDAGLAFKEWITGATKELADAKQLAKEAEGFFDFTQGQTKGLALPFKEFAEGAKENINSITKELQAAADRWKDITRTPFEQMQEQMAEIRELSKAGLLDEEAFKRSTDVILDNFLAAHDSISESMVDLNQENGRSMAFMEELARETARGMHSAFDDFYFRAMKRDFEDFGDWIEGFWDSILRSISGKLAENTIGSIGNVFGALFSPSNAPTGGITGPPAPGGGGLLSGIKSIFGLADGARITSPTLALIGEAGPEIVAPEQDFNDLVANLQAGNDRPGGDGLLSEIKSIFKLADGTRITSPTLALIGEAGPEIVAPEQDFNDLVANLQAGSDRPGGDGLLSGIKSIFGLADGARITSPTLALLGEAGPEIIAPEQDFNDLVANLKGGNDRPIILKIAINNPIDPRVFGKTDDEIITVVADGYARGKIIREVIRNDVG